MQSAGSGVSFEGKEREAVRKTNRGRSRWRARGLERDAHAVTLIQIRVIVENVGVGKRERRRIQKIVSRSERVRNRTIICICIGNIKNERRGYYSLEAG